MAETVSLGEKRFVAVVQVDGRHFLLAGGPTNIALLAQLDPNEPFEDVLKKTMTVPTKQPVKRKRPPKRAGKASAPTAAARRRRRRRNLTCRRRSAIYCRSTITAGGNQAAKQTRKQNGHATTEQTGQYA